MNILDLLRADGIDPEQVRGAKSEFCSPCPACGGRDRFISWPNEGTGGRFYCRGCERSGDLIQYLRDVRGMSYPEARDFLGQAPGTRRCSARKRKPTWTPREHPAPNPTWRRAASAFLAETQRNMWSGTCASAREWLRDARGYPTETIRHHCLGWHMRDAWVSRTAWSLPEERDDDGRSKRLWLPAGLVVPSRDAAGDLIRLKIRRPKKDHLQRYVAVSGSSMATWTLPGGPVAVIMESELDGILVAQEAGDLVTCFVLGSAQSKPDASATSQLRSAALILVSLDADDAGAKASRWWLREFPQARRWPPIQGKDPTDMHLAGVPVHNWIQAALEEFKLAPAGLARDGSFPALSGTGQARAESV